MRQQKSLDFECLCVSFLEICAKIRNFSPKNLEIQDYKKKSGIPTLSMGEGQNYSGIAHCTFAIVFGKRNRFLKLSVSNLLSTNESTLYCAKFSTLLMVFFE